MPQNETFVALTTTEDTQSEEKLFYKLDKRLIIKA